MPTISDKDLAELHAKAYRLGDSDEVKALKAELCKWRAALQRLTPGGSEFMAPEAVVEWADRKNAEYIAAKKDLVKISRKLAECESLVKLLRDQQKQDDAEVAALRAELAAVTASRKQFLDDVSEGMACMPSCDSIQHDPLCPVANPDEAFRKLREELAEYKKRWEEGVVVTAYHAAYDTWITILHEHTGFIAGNPLEITAVPVKYRLVREAVEVEE